MSTTELVKLSAAEMAAKIKAKEVSSRELVEAHLAVIESAEPSVKAFLKVSADQALEQADAFDAKSDEDKAQMPELAGVPIAIKDMIVTKGIETTAADAVPETAYQLNVLVGINGSNGVVDKYAKQLIADGYKEITLLGQNVNSYGKDLTPRVTFSQLLRQINDLPGDFRIRFMTSHPKDCTKELLDTMAECPKVAKHLHLPFQCGNDRVLKAMNRGYTAGQYLELVHYAKAKMGSALSITSDVIVGFPGETYEEFQDTLSLVKAVGATSLFTFIYSPREGTPAAKMDDPVSHKEKARWMAELLALQEQISAEQMQLHRGETFKCFVSGKGKLGDNYVAARTDGNLIIEFEGDDSLIGSFQNVKVIEPLTYVLRGELERN